MLSITSAHHERHCRAGMNKSPGPKDNLSCCNTPLRVCLEAYALWTPKPHAQPSLSVTNRSPECAGFLLFFLSFWFFVGDEALFTVFKHRFRPRGNTARGGEVRTAFGYLCELFGLFACGARGSTEASYDGAEPLVSNMHWRKSGRSTGSGSTPPYSYWGH